MGYCTAAPSARCTRAHMRPGQWRPRSTSCCRQKRHDDAAGFAVSGRKPACVNAVASAFLLTFAGLFPIVNPIEAAPFFLALTPNLSNDERFGLARRVAINGFALLLGSMVIGPWLLVFFGIELPVVRIAGGLVVTALGWKLLTEEQWSDHGEANVQPGVPRPVGSFYPLTLPLTVGPGSISVAITIG